MPDNAFLKHFFNHESRFSNEEAFNFSRKSRKVRLREIFAILRRNNVLSGFSPEQFRSILEELGPSFVKIGQVLSTRSEILPEAYCDELALLQSDVDPMSFDQVKDALADIYGERFDGMFLSIDPQPLGSASLAQVHRAVLSNGDSVAVKVQRPGVRETMAQDIDIMRSLAKRAKKILKDNQMLDLEQVVEELWNTFVEETDFTREAENLEEFALLNQNVVYIDCPRPYLEYCNPRSLVMQYIDGISIRDTERLEEEGYDLEEIGEKMLDNYATQILDHGFFHADPHPGNIFIKGGQVIYLDLGIMGRLTNRERDGFRDIIKAVGAGSASRLKDALVSFSIEADVDAIDHPRLLAELDAILDEYATIDVAEIDVGALLNQILAVTRNCKVTLPPSVAAISRGLVTLEGTLLKFAGSFNIMGIINAHLRNNQDFETQLQESALKLLMSMESAQHGLLDTAEYLGDTMRMLSRGQLKVNMEMTGSEGPFQRISHITNRIIVAILIVGLMMASALIINVEGTPEFMGMPVLSFGGFLIALILSIIVTIDVLRKS